MLDLFKLSHTRVRIVPIYYLINKIYNTNKYFINRMGICRRQMGNLIKLLIKRNLYNFWLFAVENTMFFALCIVSCFWASRGVPARAPLLICTTVSTNRRNLYFHGLSFSLYSSKIIYVGKYEYIMHII